MANIVDSWPTPVFESLPHPGSSLRSVKLRSPCCSSFKVFTDCIGMLLGDENRKEGSVEKLVKLESEIIDATDDVAAKPEKRLYKHSDEVVIDQPDEYILED